MAWLRTIVGVVVLLPSVGCTLCCSPFDNCGPLCNGECGSGCCTTFRAGGYAGELAYYEEDASGPRLAPTPAQPPSAPQLVPAQEPTPEIEEPADDSMTEPPFDTFEPSDAGIPESTESIPDTTAPNAAPLPEADPNEELPPFDEAFPPQTDAPDDDPSAPPVE